MIKLTIFTETFAHIMQLTTEKDSPLPSVNDEKFHIWMNDGSEVSVIIEASAQISAFIKQRGEFPFARTNLCLIRINQEEDLANLKVMSKIANPLIQENIEVESISSFDFDYLLIDKNHIEKFIKAVGSKFEIEKESIRK
ncbi:MAG: hypothetical protein ACI9QC_000043 [Oceanicoccus sp.]|jgi:hypothetical protein